MAGEALERLCDGRNWERRLWISEHQVEVLHVCSGSCCHVHKHQRMFLLLSTMPSGDGTHANMIYTTLACCRQNLVTHGAWPCELLYGFKISVEEDVTFAFDEDQI